MLYKYREWNDFTKSVIEDNQIFLPTRAMLNDPAELIHPVVFEKTVREEVFQEARRQISNDTFALLDNLSKKINRLRVFKKYGSYEQKCIVDKSELSEYFQISDRHWQVIEALYDRAPLHQAILYYALCLHEDAALLYDTEISIVERLND